MANSLKQDYRHVAQNLTVLSHKTCKCPITHIRLPHTHRLLQQQVSVLKKSHEFKVKIRTNMQEYNYARACARALSLSL